MGYPGNKHNKVAWYAQFEETDRKLQCMLNRPREDGTVDRYRYLHSKGVANTALALAMCHGVDFEKAYLAGLLHDAAKAFPDGERVAFCEENDIPVTDAERKNPSLLHGKMAAHLLTTEFGIQDPEIASAITYHTTGRPDMTPLEMIVYIADYIEPSRHHSEELPKMRRIAFRSLPECVFMIAAETCEHLLTKKDQAVDPMTRETYGFYQDQLNRG